MSHQVPTVAALARPGDLAQLWRLQQAVDQIRAAEPSRPDPRQVLALLDDLTTAITALAAKARDLRNQMISVQLGMTATTAYCRVKTLAGGRENGDKR